MLKNQLSIFYLKFSRKNLESKPVIKLRLFLRNNNILANIFGLGIFKIFNILITFATLPYLLRVIGVEQWGTVIFVQLITNYMIWFVNWGFYYGATRRISQKRDIVDERTLLFSEIWLAQLFLTIAVVFVFLIFLIFSPMALDVRVLYISSIGLIIGNFLTPLWYLNGLELVKESEFMLLLNKLLVLPFLYFFVTSNDDGYLYLLLNSFSSVLVGCYCILWLRKRDLFFFTKPELKKVFNVISLDFIFFVNSFLYTFNSSIVPFILGANSNMSQLGYYNVAERVRGLAVTCLQPITHALFPRMCYLFSTDTKSAQKMLRVSSVGISFLAVVISLIMFFCAEQIVIFVGGGEYAGSIQVLKVMSVSAFIVTVSSFLTDQIIIPNNWQRIISYAIFTSSIFTAALVYPVTNEFGSLGGAWLSLGAQFLVLSMLLFFLILRTNKFKFR